MTASLNAITNAANNGTLKQRLEEAAKAAGLGQTDAASASVVWENATRLVSIVLPSTGQSIAETLHYYQTQYETAVAALPADPASDSNITDAMLLEALSELLRLRIEAQNGTNE